MKSKISLTSVSVAKLLEHVEAKVAEAELEEDDSATFLADGDMNEVTIDQISSKMPNLILLKLATGEANAVVRRCRGKQRLLAWKKLCTTLNPRNLASGVKAISQVTNPPKIADAKRRARRSRCGRTG